MQYMHIVGQGMGDNFASCSSAVIFSKTFSVAQKLPENIFSALSSLHAHLFTKFTCSDFSKNLRSMASWPSRDAFLSA